MTREMYDSVTAKDIPSWAALVGGYVSGPYKWKPADWAMFPNAVHVPIATQANVNDGVVLDVERGDATPEQAPGWVERRRAAGIDPTVYCSLSVWDEVKRAFEAAHVPQPHYWIAHYDGADILPVGTVAKQYINPPNSGGHYDRSIVADYWPGIDPLPEVPMSLDLNTMVPIILKNKQTGQNDKVGETTVANLLSALYASEFLQFDADTYDVSTSKSDSILTVVNALTVVLADVQEKVATLVQRSGGL
jgi:hypothetical protein